MPLTQSELDTLEGMLDRCGLAALLESVSHIASEKAEHIRANWQDTTTAERWDDAALDITNCADSIAIQQVSA